MLRAQIFPLLPALLALFLPRAAFALQPLETFTTGAAGQPTLRAAEAQESKADAESDVALGPLLPTFAARGVYTRNQYEASVRLPGAPQSIVITPQDQLDAFLSLDIPLVNVAAWYRKGAASAGLENAKASRASTAVEVEEVITRAYYRLVGAEALRESALASVKASEDNLAIVKGRVEVGISPELDRQRAEANLARAHQDVADAELTVALARRSLKTLSGVEPTEGATLGDVTLEEAAPLAQWMGKLGESPAVRAARAAARSNESQARAARAALLPTLGANATERFTNATGFAGRSNYYTITANVSWAFDVGAIPRIRSQAAGAEILEAREELAQQVAEDKVHEQWQRIKAGIARTKAARAQAAAAKRARELSEDRYQAGAATQLDVVTAQRDAFVADAARIQSDAELVLARRLLVLSVANGTERNVR